MHIVLSLYYQLGMTIRFVPVFSEIIFEVNTIKFK